MQLLYTLRGAVWISVYLLFILAPLFALLTGSHPPSRVFWTEFSVAIGYSGLAMMGLQFGLTARFKHVTEPWGEDVIYHFHRQISLIAVALVIAHPVILFVVRPELLALLNSITAPWRARLAAALDLLADRAGGDGAVAYPAEAQLRVLAPHAHRARGGRRRGGHVHMVGWSFYLEDPWKRALWIGLTIFWVGLLLYVRIVKPLFILRRPYRVAKVRHERGNTYDPGDAARGSPRLPLPPGPVRLADGVGQPVQDHRPPVLLLVERRGRPTATSRCRSAIWATSPSASTRCRWASASTSMARTARSPSATRPTCTC